MARPPDLEHVCRRCGGSVVGSDLGGLCPRCLAASLFDEATGVSDVAGAEEAEPVLRRLGGYELVEELARGGMGIVFRARQIGLGRTVAVKLLRESWLATPEMVERFQTEAASAARLRHPRIVAIHEVGVEAGQHFFAMELVEGRNLEEATRGGPLEVRRAAWVVAEVAGAVQHAHERGVVHRDLKPSNVLLDGAGQPHVTDFGLAHPLDEVRSLTLTGQVLGTPGYMAPEQAEGRGTIGVGADVYGVGALLYHLLTARAPFVGSGVAATLAQVLQREPVSPRLLNPSVPPDLAAVCLKCLAKRAPERYGSASEVAEEMQRFLRGEPTRARPTGPLKRAWRWCRRQPAMALVVGVALGALALGLGGTTWQWRAAAGRLRKPRTVFGKRKYSERGAIRRSGAMGHRDLALESVREAAAFRVTAEVRSEAIAALALFELRPLGQEHPVLDGSEHTLIPPTYGVSPRGEWLATWASIAPSQTRIRFERSKGAAPVSNSIAMDERETNWCSAPMVGIWRPATSLATRW